MENQSDQKTKSNLGISLLTGCVSSLAAFIAPIVFFFALILWQLPTESGLFMVIVLGPGCGAILALIVAIAAGVGIYRAMQPRPMATGLLTWAGISLLTNIVISGATYLAQDYLPSSMTGSNSGFIVIVLVMTIIANLLAIIVGWLVYRRQRSKVM
jgi:hypothetical protein